MEDMNSEPKPTPTEEDIERGGRIAEELACLRNAFDAVESHAIACMATLIADFAELRRRGIEIDRLERLRRELFQWSEPAAERNTAVDAIMRFRKSIFDMLRAQDMPVSSVTGWFPESVEAP